MPYNKLVRDNIPDIIRANGEHPTTHTATDLEYRVQLFAKLLEEARELIANPSVEELADITEVLRAISVLLDISPEHLEHVRLAKRSERGGFTQRIILERVE